MSEVHKKFGELLKTERENRKIDLADLAEQLKISESHLEAIEQGDLGGVLSELYYGLFSKSYSESLGIDYTRTMDAIESDLGPELGNGGNGKKKSSSEKSEESLEEGETDESGNKMYKNLLRLFGLIIVVFILFMTANKLFFSGDTESGEGTTGNEDEQSSAVATPTVPEKELAGYDWEAAQYAEKGKIKLLITPRNESWSTVIADGDTVIYRTLRVGRIYSAEADYRLLVSIGIPSAVDIRLNDKTVNLVNPETRRISRVEINQMNLESFLNPQEISSEDEGASSES